MIKQLKILVNVCFIFPKYKSTCIQNGLKYEKYKKKAQVQPFRQSGLKHYSWFPAIFSQVPKTDLLCLGNGLHFWMHIVRAYLVCSP